MSIAIVTGAGGLIGAETVRHFAGLGLDVVGVDNDMRGQLFGPDGSVAGSVAVLRGLDRYVHYDADVRDHGRLSSILAMTGRDTSLVVHCAAQPAHDSPDPLVDWDVNATGTVNVLDAVRRHAPDAVVVVLSTIKVYGQQPNELHLLDNRTRYEVVTRTAYYDGIDETMSVDGSARSVFGASKLAADLMAQEYGQTLGLRTVVLRPGCLTGSAHAAVEAHGFLGHLVRCVATGRPYRIQGNGKQVRDQVHAADVVSAIEQIWRDPPEAGEVFNLGGGRGTELSVLEAVALAEEVTGLAAKVEHVEPRHGDHRWWVTDTTKLQRRYPAWSPTRTVRQLVEEIADRWLP